MKHAADILTGGRIVAAVALIFTSPLSAPCFILYTYCGVSDMLDGTIARKLGTAGGFGAKLDSVADLLFLLSAAYKLLPSMLNMLTVFSLWAVAISLILKLISLITGAIKFRKLCFLHTYFNKLTGTAVFILPYFFRTGFFPVLLHAACVIAVIAAAEELICVLHMKEYDADIKGLYRKH